MAPNSNAFLSFVSEWVLGVGGTGKGDAVLGIYPNPATSSLSITSPMADGELMIMDALGKIAYKTTIDRTTKIDVGNWKRGVYFARWIGDDGDVAATKLVIE